jgi:hypothetical protein
LRTWWDRNKKLEKKTIGNRSKRINEGDGGGGGTGK